MSLNRRARKLRPLPPTAEMKKARSLALRQGFSEDELPGDLQDKLLGATPEGPLGKIEVRSMTGIHNRGTAARAFGQFLDNLRVTGQAAQKTEVAEKLEACGKLPEPVERFARGLRTSGAREPMLRLMAEVGTEPVTVMRYYAEGCAKLGKLEAGILAHPDLPILIKDIFRHALDHSAVCEFCVGLGKVKPSKSTHKDSAVCPICQGSGITHRSSKLKKFAVEKILEITKMVEGPGMKVNVNQQVGVNVAPSSFAERMYETSEKILYARTEAPVDAEIVQPEDHQ